MPTQQVHRIRLFALILSGACVLCVIGLRLGRTQSIAPHRITNTSEEAININPSISGDGRTVAFESTEDLAAAGGTDQFRAIRANVGTDPASFLQIAGTRAVSPAVSQDGSRIAFASGDDPMGTNADGNLEIFLYDGSRLTQVTNTSPGGLANRTTNGNFQPSISDDGRFIAFSSNRDLVGQNGDGNLEIFVFDSLSHSFSQLTNSAGIVGFTDVKISGNGNFVAYIRDHGATPGTTRDLIQQPRLGGGTNVLASAVASLTLTYGRAISDDGTRVVYSSQTATNTTQVFLYDGRGVAGVRQITSLGARVTEVPLHPSISGDGSRISFATRRNVNGGNTDGSVELYLYDIPTAAFSRITSAPSAATTDVVSSLNDDGSVVAFSFPRVLSGAVTNSDLANDSEIYLASTQPRPSFGTLTVLNGASLGNEPATTEAVAPDSIAVARGGLLANSTIQPQRPANGAFPTNVGGTTVTVNGRSAQIFFVSPSQVNFLIPPQTELGTADVVVTNSEGFPSRGSVATLRSAPGMFTKLGDGTGEALALNSDTLQEGPFDPGDGKLRLTIFATGARNATQLSVTIRGQVLVPELVLSSPEMPGLDEIHLKAPASLKGAGVVNVSTQADGRDGNPVSTRFVGGDILINEVLADPPGAAPTDLIGDANHDGVRSSSDDEFVELVNSTSHDIDISGYQMLARSSGAANDTLRHTFAAGTIVAARTAVVVFGGDAPNPSDPIFGGALVLKASTGGLSLSNTGGIVTLRDRTGAVANIFEYGAATGLSGGSNQSLTRSPDITGAFTTHATAAGANGRLLSPGTRVDGTPFVTIPIARIDLTPISPTIDAGAKQQFTAKAFDAVNQEVNGVIFVWQSSNPGVATIDPAGLASSTTAGATQITASGRGLQSAPDTLTVRAVQRVLTSVEVTPNPATIPATGAQQFTARGLDQFGNEITGLTFAWESSAANVATIDQNGLANGIADGQSTIKATTQSVSGTALLNVTAPTLLVNEVLADPPAGNEGDANHDGTRDGAQDEFVELVNATGVALNISGWTLRTHSTSSTSETVRHTFAANTNVPAGSALVVFGGGTFDPANPLFGCARVVKTSTSGLSLTNGGLTILIRDAGGNLITEFSYGGSTGLNGGNAQSLTRSPDTNGNFVLHTSLPAASGRKFSAGLKLDGTPFGNCPGHPASVTVSPASTSAAVGQSASFTAQAFDQFGRAVIGVPITFTSDNTAVATIDSTTPNPMTGVVTAGVGAHNPGTAHITASANDGTTTANSNQATLTVNGPALSINDLSVNEGNAGVTTVTFTVSLSQPAAAGGVTFDIATANGTATSASGDYVARSLTNQTIPAGQNSYSFDVTVNGDTLVEANENFFVNLYNVSANATIGDAQGAGTIQNDDAPLLVISQLYGGGGNAGAILKNDFIEIYNRGTSTVDLAGWSVQYMSAAGTGNWSVTPLCPTGSCLIQPGRHFLVQEDQGSGGTQDLPTPDASGTIAMTTAAGKVALSSSLTALNGACPVNAGIFDIVGYGSSATCFEGSGPAPAPGNTTADFRKAGGCVDTNDNANDFFVSQPNPRNSASPDGDCKPEITINDVTVAENNSGTVNATFTVNLAAASAQTVTVDFATADGTANAPADFQTNNGTLTLSPGDLTKTITVLVNGDTLDEVAETFFVNLSNAGNALILDNQGQGTINDNDPAPSLSINDVSIAESDSGTETATFTVLLSTASGQTVTVNYATADNTATAGSDYQSGSGSLTFNPGDTSKTLAVTIIGDTTFEPNETFFVNLSGAVNASISDNQGTGTITNDDPAPPVPTFSINDISIAEGDGGTSVATFNVTLSQASGTLVTVDYATADGTATVVGSDYQSANGTLSFGIGETSKPISVSINGDTLVESDETFVVNLTNATGGSIIGDNQGAGTIQNDDVANLVISQVYPGGGLSGAIFTNDFIEIFNGGTTTVDFSATPYSVQFLSTSAATWAKTDLTFGTVLPGRYFLVREASGGANGAALPTADATGTLNLTSTTAGKVALVFSAILLTGSCPGDDGAQPFNPLNANVVDFVGYGGTALTANHCYEGSAPASFTLSNNTIADYRKAGGCTDTNQNASDFFTSTPAPRNSSSPANNCAGGAAPSLSINYVSVTEGNSGTTPATFTVSLSAASQGGDVTFDIATQDNTATTANSDYVPKSLTNQIIPAGQTTYSFTVTINGDTSVEPDETFFVNITNVAGASVTGGQGAGTIQHDDLPALSIDDVSAFEGDSGTTTFTFHVSLSAAAPATVTFDILTADNTATTVGNDYVSQALTEQTIAQGASSFDFAINVNGDTADEGTETFFVNVSNVSGATVLDGQGLGTIQNDDAPPALSINDVTQAETNSLTTFTFTVQLSAPAKPGGVNFTIDTADGITNPALAGSDYGAIVKGNGSIAQGNSSTTVSVTVNGDTVFEPNETFFVNLTNINGATATDSQGVGTITNDDAQPTISIADAGITEGASGTSLMTFTATLTGSSQSTVSVNYATADSSATIAGSDYDAAGGTLNFAPGDSSETFTVTIHGDTNAEGDEMFLVDLSSPSGATISDGQALGIIFLDDPFSIGTVNTAYTENFDGLDQTGASATTPTAWTRAESGSGANTTYTGNNGSSTTGDTYSYGSATTPTDRALGGLRTGSVVPTIGAFYRNDTGSTINTLQISYTGEEWRLGNAVRTDRLDFQYSLNANGLATGTWTDVDLLDFTTPNTATTGSKDGNNGTNRTVITHTITGLSIAAGSTFWIRWTDLDASGADDGLAVDDFSITAGVDTPSLSISDVTAAETNGGTRTFNFTVSLTSPAPPGGVSFIINTADGPTNAANAGTDYVAIVNGSGSITQNGTTTTVSVTVNGDTDIEPDETFFVNLSSVTGATVADGQGLGTITNDDAPAGSADLSVTKIDSPDPVAIGNNITYTITLNNFGPDAAVNAVLADTVPTNTTFRSITPPASWTCPTQPAVGGTGAISCSNASFAIGSAVFTLVVRVGTSVTDGTVISNTASVSSSTSDPNIGDESAIQTTTVRQPSLVISQIYPGGGNAGATYTNDFIEIFNRGTTTVDFAATNYSLQYTGQAGNFGGAGATVKFDLTAGTIAPGQYFLVQAASGGVNGVALPNPDATSLIAMSATAGKVALVLGTAALASDDCPGDDNVSPFNPNVSTIVDFVGYGGTAASTTCYEGSGPAPFSTSTAGGLDPDARSTIRALSCVDTGSNSSDFSNPTTAPTARNKLTALVSCP